MVKIAVTALAVVLLLTAAAVSTATDGRARLRAFLMMVCVVSQINLGRLLAREAALARTPAARRCYAVSAVACFVELALKLYMILVLVSLCAVSVLFFPKFGIDLGANELVLVVFVSTLRLWRMVLRCAAHVWMRLPMDRRWICAVLFSSYTSYSAT